MEVSRSSDGPSLCFLSGGLLGASSFAEADRCGGGGVDARRALAGVCRGRGRGQRGRRGRARMQMSAGWEDVGMENVVDVMDGDLDLVDAAGPEARTKTRERRRTGELLSHIEQGQPEGHDVAPQDLGSVQRDELAPACFTAIRAAEKRKCIDPVVLRISHLTFIASFIIMVSGKSPPQIRAIRNSIEEQLAKEHKRTPRNVSGTPNSGWILMDYGDVLVNIFSVEQRQYYDLESRWSRGEMLDISSRIAGPTEAEEVEYASVDDWLV